MPEAPASWHRGAATMLIAVAALGTTLGIGYPFFSLYLAQHGASSAAVAVSGAMTSIGMVAAAPLLPVLVRRLGLWGVLALSLAVMVATLAAIGAVRSEAAWFPLRLLLGATINGVFGSSETWLNQAAPEHVRGRILAGYSSALSAGAILGPLLLALVGTRTLVPFVVLVCIAGAAMIPVLLARRDEPALVRGEVESFSLRGFSRHVGPLLGAILALAFFSAAVLSLLPLYLGARGASVRATALGITVLLLGSLFLQVPIGWLADHVNRRRLLVACAAAGVLGGVLLPFLAPSGPLLWLVLFAWGGFAYGVYPLGLGVLGSSLTSAQLVTANAVWSFVWGIGGVVGLPAAGAAMSVFGASALPVVLALVWGVAVVWMLAAGRRRSPVPID